MDINLSLDVDWLPLYSPIPWSIYIIEVLRGTHRDTEAQVDLIQQARRTPGALKDRVTAQIVTAYCVQRTDLIGYHRMLTV